MTQVSWDPPGPGTWELDTTHFDTQASRIARDIMVEAMDSGMSTGLEMVGAPLKSINVAFVNGRMYIRLVPLVGGSRNLPLPPKPVLWLMTRVHPEFRRRAKRSVTALENRIWLDEAATWEAEWKPKLVETNRRLGAVDQSSLSDAALNGHFNDLIEHLRWSAAMHFRLHVSDLGPIGQLMIAAEDWGLDQRAVMEVLAGSSPSTSAPARALAGIRDELERCGATPSSLDEVSAASERAAELLKDYLDEFGNRLTTGYDIRDWTLGELPDVVLASIVDARHVDNSAAARGEASLTALREGIAAERLVEFDRLVSDARLLYGLRDENGPLTFEWPAGILRHAVLEIGRRLVTSGKIVDLEHVFDATAAELTGLIGGGSTPTSAELARRCAERQSYFDLEPKAVLGPAPQQPPLDVLPGRMPEMMRGVLMVTDLLDGDIEQLISGGADSDELSGTGIGTEPYRGIARVVASADEALDRAEPGDIIVTRFTVPTFNSVLAMAGGVVTQNGGLLCHTAVIARELGIPAVVGVASALTAIPDGAEIEIDPVAGRVRVVVVPGTTTT